MFLKQNQWHFPVLNTILSSGSLLQTSLDMFHAFILIVPNIGWWMIPCHSNYYVEEVRNWRALLALGE
jgi:hypothetical protein